MRRKTTLKQQAKTQIGVVKTDFFQNVFDVVQLIPEGRISTYGAIASYLGARRSARMVGWAMNISHTSGKSIPAHRVVNRNGMLTGKHHFGDPNLMSQLLINEGASIENDVITNFKQMFWDPALEL